MARHVPTIIILNHSRLSVLFFAEGVVEDVEEAEEEKSVAGPCKVFVVFFDFFEEHIGGDVQREPVTECGEDAVPYQCS